MPDDPETGPFHDLAVTLQDYRDDLPPRSHSQAYLAANRLALKIEALFTALEPLTPADLDALTLLVVNHRRHQAAKEAEVSAPMKVEPREWIRLDDGTALYAADKPGGTHVWDKDGQEWVSMRPAVDVQVWMDPRNVYKVHLMPNQAPPGM